MRTLLLLAVFIAQGCGEVWNDPYPAAERNTNTLYAAFTERPKHLDPVQSYTSDEAAFIRQVYEPPLQYHYLKRPYELIPLTAESVPAARELPDGQMVYEVRIRKGIRYQPHPAFHPANMALDRRRIERLATPYELPTATRELTADDYIYQVKRLAHPRLHSPIFGLMAEHIVGLAEYAKRLKEVDRRVEWLDLREHALEGIERIDSHSFRIRLKGRYTQFVYWLAMPFFSPLPWEAEKFFHQPGMAERNFTLDWWPVGTGPYMLVENNPNARMTLQRNPNFRGEAYPADGEPADANSGMLADAGKGLPFIERAVFSREKEAIPYWNKFIQGYYDSSGIASDNFDQAVRVSVEGEATLTADMEARGIQLETSVAATVYYLGVNWLDPVLGGQQGGAAAERARKLRQAIAIAIDWEEYLTIFANGRGIVASGPIPPGIFGFRDGAGSVNALTHEWVDGAARRRPIEAARKLLAEAGYPDGRDASTGKPLVLYMDATARGPADKARFDWWRKQFSRLSIQLEIRDTDWNRFQEKIRKGTQQLFMIGWSADYPDPENFLFLLHGVQSRAKSQGQNAANYENAEYDALFERMKNLPNDAERARLIAQMLDLLRRDVPWIGGFHPKTYSLRHDWLANMKPNEMADNGLKYWRLAATRREAARRAWNRPVLWPLVLAVVVLVCAAVPAVVGYRRRERMAARLPG